MVARLAVAPPSEPAGLGQPANEMGFRRAQKLHSSPLLAMFLFFLQLLNTRSNRLASCQFTSLTHHTCNL